MSAEVLTPASRPQAKLPRISLVAVLVVLFFDLSFPKPQSSSFSDTIEAPFLIAALLAGVTLGAWLEERFYGWAENRPPALRVLLVVLFPPLAFVLGLVAAGLLGAAMESLGLGDTTIILLFVTVFWAACAGLGSAIVVLVDVVASRLRDFRSRILLTVLGLLGTVAAVVGSTATVARVAFETVAARGSNFSIDLGDGQVLTGQQAAEVLSQEGLNELLTLILVVLLVVTLLPAAVSAAGKLGELAMERVHPLDQAFQRIAAGQLSVRVEEGGSVEFARLGRHFNEMVEALELARDMERAFGAYVSAPVLQKIRAQHGAVELPSSARVATVFFADVRGFTAMSEKLEPQQVLDVLDRYYESVVSIVEAHEGYIDKFIGDAIYVVFNGPLDQDDHVERCARCAIEIMERIDQLNAEGAFPEVGQLHVGMGIATGPVVAGSLGSQRHVQFSVIGDTVNLASRLTNHAPPGEIWVNDTCAARLPDTLETAALEPIAVKGKEREVVPFRLWPREAADKVSACPVDVNEPEPQPDPR